MGSGGTPAPLGHQVGQAEASQRERGSAWEGMPLRKARGLAAFPDHRKARGLAAFPDRRKACGLAAGVGDVLQLDRAIRTGKLRMSPCFYSRPIDVVVFHGSRARPGCEEGFPLRCFQRLSRPYLATRLRGWRHDRSTRGTSTPVLSY